MKVGDYVNFRNGGASPDRHAGGTFPVYGANGPIGFADTRNATGPVIVIGRVGSYCGSLHYVAIDSWITENSISARGNDPTTTHFWYYAPELPVSTNGRAAQVSRY